MVKKLQPKQILFLSTKLENKSMNKECKEGLSLYIWKLGNIPTGVACERVTVRH